MLQSLLGASVPGCFSGWAKEDDPAHWPPRTDRTRPDACLPVCCTLPDKCSLLGFQCVKSCCAPCTPLGDMHDAIVSCTATHM
mmetsp:Transcript_20255/g.65140  ORF Transcript_20255/g.65140 Transcript_20255/m.65140 type:complete len:83 (+) Transcript_20255:106-354(+)